jgi:type VI secretion system protein
MRLVLHLTAKDPALGEAAGRRIQVDERLTIGRGQDNDLVLADPERHLSKNHCVIECDGDGFTVTDTSTNGVYLDDRTDRLPRNAPVPLREGSVLRVGGYQLKIIAIAPGHAMPPPAPRGAGLAAPGPRLSDDGLFGDPLAGAPAAGASDSGLPPDVGKDIAGLPTPFASPVIPDDIDLLGPPAEQQWHGVSQPDNVPADQVFFTPPKVTGEKLPEDWERSAFR